MTIQTMRQETSELNCFGAEEAPGAKVDILTELELTEDDWNLNETELSTFNFEL